MRKMYFHTQKLLPYLHLNKNAYGKFIIDSIAPHPKSYKNFIKFFM